MASISLVLVLLIGGGTAVAWTSRVWGHRIAKAWTVLADDENTARFVYVNNDGVPVLAYTSASAAREGRIATGRTSILSPGASYMVVRDEGDVLEVSAKTDTGKTATAWVQSRFVRYVR